MAKFCKYCGAQLRDGAKFCNKCGARFDGAPAQTKAPVHSEAPAYSAPVQTAAPVISKKQVKKAAKKSVSTGLIILLAAILAVEGVVAGLWFPGFFTSKEKGEEKVTKDNLGSIIAEDLGAYNNENDNDDADVESLPLTEDIKIKYSDEEVNSAPAQTVKVSPQNPVVTVGDVKVDFKGWNLNGEDELTVRTLGQKTEDGGWTVNAYDFSLKSGQNTFATNVAITIPRTAAKGELGSCIGFNEDEGKWEDLYSETSEDGKFYTLYTTHFSKKGEKLSYIYKNYKLHKNDTGEEFNTDSGAFIEKIGAGLNQMKWPVEIDFDTLWNLYTNVDDQYFETALNGLNKRTGAVSKDSIVGTIGNIFGFLGAGNDLNTMYNEYGKEVLKGITQNSKKLTAGDYLTLVNYTLIFLKAYTEAEKNNTTYAKALWNHKGEIFTAFAAVKIGAAYGGFYGAAASLAFFGALKLYDVAVEAYNSTVPILDENNPTYEGLYKAFYLDYNYGVTYQNKASIKDRFGEASTWRINMSKPPSMDEEDFAKLKKAVKAATGKYWSDSLTINTIQYPDDDSEGERKIYASPAWAKVLVELCRIYSSDAGMLETVLDEFYERFAYAFWELPQETLDDYFESVTDVQPAFSSRKTLDTFGIDEGFKIPAGKIRLKLTKKLVKDIKSATADMLTEAIETVQRESIIDLEKKMKTELLPILNTKLVFHVKDTTLKEGQTFADSKYCVDWTKIDDNAFFPVEYYNSEIANHETPLFSADTFIAPIKFDCVDEPLFMPMTYDGDDPVKEYYYPYNCSFTPRAKQGQKSDVVYSCTYYHYLMMGSPKRMIFTDVTGKEKTLKSKIKLPEIDGKNKKVDVFITVGKTKGAKLKYSSDNLSKEGGYINADQYALKAAFKASTCVIKGNTVKISGKATVNSSEYSKVDKSRVDSGSISGSASASFTLTGELDGSGGGKAVFSADASCSHNSSSQWKEGSYNLKGSDNASVKWHYSSSDVKLIRSDNSITVEFTADIKRSGTHTGSQHVKGPYSDHWTEVSEGTGKTDLAQTTTQYISISFEAK